MKEPERGRRIQKIHSLRPVPHNIDNRTRSVYFDLAEILYQVLTVHPKNRSLSRFCFWLPRMILPRAPTNLPVLGLKLFNSLPSNVKKTSSNDFLKENILRFSTRWLIRFVIWCKYFLFLLSTSKFIADDLRRHRFPYYNYVRTTWTPHHCLCAFKADIRYLRDT